MALRTRNAAMLVKIESTPGTPVVPSASTDGVKIEVNGNPMTFNPEIDQPNEVSGSLDIQPSIVGGLKPNINGSVYLTGGGAASVPAAGTAPEYNDLLKIGGLTETLVATQIPADGSAAAASGTATTATFDRTSGDNSELSGTTGAYDGMMVELSGNPSTAVQVQVKSYVVTGNNAVFTFAETFSPNLSSSTVLRVLPQAHYKLNSAPPTATIEYYIDGRKYIFAGCRTAPSLVVPTAHPGKWTFGIFGQFVSVSDAAVPSVTYQNIPKPILKAGGVFMDRLAAGINQFGLNFGISGTYPPNPAAAQGFDPYEIISRKLTGTLDPQMTLIATRNLMADFLAGTPKIIAVRYGSVAGNRVGIMVPAAKYVGNDPGDLQGIVVENTPFDAEGENTGAYYTIY